MHLYPEAGAPRRPRALYAAAHPESGVCRLGALPEQVGESVPAVPNAYVSTTVDVSPWAETEWAAILAHRGEVASERPLPGVPTRLPEAERQEMTSTESFTRPTSGPVPGGPHRLTV
ncbi:MULTISPECIES: hypothetical protein [unclassified Streptomyces]|uniref:hypothetical protein n=1 Tax=unclassified Streptomyces TaxID=2593676 RepID=UPI00380E9253